jgi:hypothetical protein
MIEFHSGHPDPGLDDLQPGVGELGVAVTDQEFRPGAGVFQVHDQVPAETRVPTCRLTRQDE